MCQRVLIKLVAPLAAFALSITTGGCGGEEIDSSELENWEEYDTTEVAKDVDGDESAVDSEEYQLARAGRWTLPDAVRQTGDAQHVTYDSAPAWNNGANCSAAFQPGAQHLGAYLVEAFEGASRYEGLNCREVRGRPGSMSMHGTGRALDIYVNVADGEADNDLGDPIANYLVQNASRIGVQYILWDRTQWRGWHHGRKDASYNGAHAHHDHLHVELTVEGANQQTLWFTDPAGNPSPAGVQADDHGNDRRHATTIRLNRNYAGNIEVARDYDWFGFRANRNQQVILHTTGRTDTYCDLYNSRGRRLARNDDGGAGTNCRITHRLGRGTHYLRVRHFSPRGTGPYQVRVELARNVEPRDDHGNSRRTATRLRLGRAQPGRIERRGDRDYFRFDLSGRRRINLYTTGRTDTYCDLQDSRGRRITRNDNSGSGSNCRIRRRLNRGTYYVRVRHDSQRRTGSYSIRVDARR